jgi:hypothetical protein
MERVGTGLAKIAREILRGAPAGEVPLLAWPLVCGTAVAARTRAVGFQRGVLRVEVSDTAWRAQLVDLAPQYIASFARLLRNQRVERIEFELVAGPSGSSPR